MLTAAVTVAVTTTPMARFPSQQSPSFSGGPNFCFYTRLLALKQAECKDRIRGWALGVYSRPPGEEGGGVGWGGVGESAE